MKPPDKPDKDEDDPFDIGEEDFTTPLQILGLGHIEEMDCDKRMDDMLSQTSPGNYDESGGQQ